MVDVCGALLVVVVGGVSSALSPSASARGGVCCEKPEDRTLRE